MHKGFTLIAGMVMGLGACSTVEVEENDMKQTDSWKGTYSHYTEIPGADDGTNSYSLEIKKSGKQYDVSYSDVSMVSYTYKGSGRENKVGGLDVFFTSFQSNKGFTKNFKPGNHMFSLKKTEKGSKTGIQLDWQIVPGDDLRRSSVTLFRQDPPEKE